MLTRFILVFVLAVTTHAAFAETDSADHQRYDPALYLFPASCFMWAFRGLLPLYEEGTPQYEQATRGGYRAFLEYMRIRTELGIIDELSPEEYRDYIFQAVEENQQLWDTVRENASEAYFRRCHGFYF